MVKLCNFAMRSTGNQFFTSSNDTKVSVNNLFFTPHAPLRLHTGHFALQRLLTSRSKLSIFL